MSPQELAAKVGVTQRVVAYWEREASSLTANPVEAPTTALQVSADSLLARRPVRRRDAGPDGRIRKVFECGRNLQPCHLVSPGCRIKKCPSLMSAPTA